MNKLMISLITLVLLGCGVHLENGPALVSGCLLFAWLMANHVGTAFKTGVAFVAVLFVPGMAFADAVTGSAAGDMAVGLVLQNVIAAHPIASAVVSVFALSQPLISLLATQTKNPTANRFLIFTNKLLQLVSFKSSRNQPDVLSIAKMVTNRPKEWPRLINEQVADEAESLQRKLVIDAAKGAGVDGETLNTIFNTARAIRKELRK